ncbi:MAG: hypothetical protein KC877_05205 [Candidatus Kaiserbacteria bacterium]|nr:hypothetical protein [Candidatus Kaiserbacteria bacterium]MCB9816048.1 hypothetical protein [Candidatus Nomurabacteria bacterium]
MHGNTTDLSVEEQVQLVAMRHDFEVARLHVYEAPDTMVFQASQDGVGPSRLTAEHFLDILQNTLLLERPLDCSVISRNPGPAPLGEGSWVENTVYLIEVKI